MGQLVLNAHTYTTILRSFFWDHPGEPVAEENFWALCCKGRLTEADTRTIRLDATPSGLTSDHLHHPPHICKGPMPFLPPNRQCQSTEGKCTVLNGLLDNSQICQLADCQLADWMIHGLVKSRTRQLAYWTTRGCHRRLYVLSFHSFGGICETASCPVRELAYPRVVQLPLNAAVVSSFIQ